MCVCVFVCVCASRVCETGDLGFELKMQEQRHQEEVTALKKRLQWYAENQELLDRDAGRLRAATAEVKNLTEQVSTIRTSHGLYQMRSAY